MTEKPKPRAVYQYDRTGKFIQSFSSVEYAARCMNFPDKASEIARAASGLPEQTTVFGFRWSYKLKTGET